VGVAAPGAVADQGQGVHQAEEDAAHGQNLEHTPRIDVHGASVAEEEVAVPAQDTRDAALRRVYQDARAAGLDDEGARVAVAIAMTEHGYEGGVGDTDRSALGSAGTFQLYFGGGQGNNFARAHGMPERQARDYLKNNPHAANEWALNGYLGQAIRRGQAKGYHGADLATYAQDVGQGSESPERSGANYRTVSMDVGGGGPSVASNGQAVSGGQALFDRIVAAKGDPVGITAVDPQIETETDETNFIGEPTGKKIKTKTPNPTPAYRYEFADGTSMVARTPQGGGLVIVDGGTAATSAARSPTAGGSVVGGQTPNEQYIVTVMPDGSVRQSPNPNYVPPKEPKPPNNKTVINRGGKAYIYDPDTNTFTPAQGLPDDPGKTTTHTVGGRAFTLDESGKVVSSVDLRSPQQVQKEGVDLETAQVDLAGKRQELLPKQQQILQGHLDTVKYVQGMLERNEIDQAQADAYVAASKAAAQAALRGATPFQEMKEKREAEQASQRMGTDLLTQRLSSGAGLASSLLSSATSLAGHAMLRPGQTSLGVDPLSQLMPILSQLQGGSDITPFARGLLMGGQQGPPGVPGPLPAGL